MRVIVCNKYFFLNGGTERYMRNVMGRLEASGHEAVPFSVAYAKSWESPYSGYFLPPPGNPDEIYLNQIRLRPANAASFFGRAIYSFEARRAAGRLLDALGGADAAYLLNIYNFMSPSILDTFKARGIRSVVRLGDYNLLCANYKLFRDGRPCELCVGGNHLHGLAHRCVHGSLAASAVRIAALFVQRLLGVWRSVYAFVAPCRFMRGMLVRGGIPADKVAILRQPAEPALVFQTAPPGPPVILYFGRLSDEKGLDVLVKAYQEANPGPDLMLVGRSYNGCRERLRALVRPDFTSRIHFKDFTPAEELSPIIAGACLSVAPSIWYDNAPQSVLESYLHATPVLGARIGGIPDEILPGRTGDTFLPGSVADLARALRTLTDDKDALERMGRQAREYALKERSFEAHMARLLPLLQGLALPGDLT